jgi:N-acetylglucosamine-6-phosphate deacetylase
MLYIQNATVFTPTEQIDTGALLTDGTRIAAVGPVDEIPCPDDAQIIDAAGLFLAPGFIDLQINGAFGYDFTGDPTTIWPVAAKLPRYGVTAFLPTIISSPLETVAAAQKVVTQAPVSGVTGAIPLGLHIEGPFLNPKRKGAHNPEYLLSPDLGAVANWSPEYGVRLVTLAPELPGALELVALLTKRGVAVSAGHSNSTYAEAQAGFDAGICYGTHLFNAMPPLHHRESGLIGALLNDPRLVVGMIADGIHTHPSMVGLAWQTLGYTRLNLVTDAMAALGIAPGQHLLGDYDVIVDETSARLADGTLAGSILSLDVALRNLVAFSECSLADALPTITTTPAELLGLSDQRGQLAPGYLADLVLLSPEFDVVLTIIEGRIAFKTEDQWNGHD